MAKPAWQPQPTPPAPSTPGINSGPNGRPPGKAQVPQPNAATIQTTAKQAQPQQAAGGAAGGVVSPPGGTYRFKIPSSVYPDVVAGRHEFNVLTGEWLNP